MKTAFVSLLAILLLSQSSQAQTNERLLECRGLTDLAARLKCYDTIPLSSPANQTQSSTISAPLAQKALPDVVTGAPSILPQCLDPGPSVLGAGPSARARECTRQQCDETGYKAKVTAYVRRTSHNASEQREALTCITRSEQDREKR